MEDMMYIEKMTTKEIIDYVDEKSQWGYFLSEYCDELRRRVCAPKQPYQIKYKFMPNDRDIDDMKALTVWGTSPLAACQALVDANDWLGQSMEFQVNEHYFTSDDLE